MNEHDEQEFDELRRDYGKLPTDAPSEISDARIRAEARRAIRPRNRAAWTGVLALAASVGFAAVLLPQLLTETGRPGAEADQAMPAISESTVAAGQAETEATAARARGHDAREPAADAEVAQRQSRRASKLQVESQPATGAAQEQAFAAMAPAASDADRPGLEQLRQQLESAPEPEWRATLVELRDSDRRALAEELMPDYRRKFEIDESATLDTLVVEED